MPHLPVWARVTLCDRRGLAAAPLLPPVFCPLAEPSRLYGPGGIDRPDTGVLLRELVRDKPFLRGKKKKKIDEMQSA